jgi:hypothetical protein
MIPVVFPMEKEDCYHIRAIDVRMPDMILKRMDVGQKMSAAVGDCSTVAGEM